MPQGVPVGRQWVLISPEGEPIIDWGSGLYQNVYTGDFIEHETELMNVVMISDDQLCILKRNGQVSSFDANMVYFINLPERNISTID